MTHPWVAADRVVRHLLDRSTAGPDLAAMFLAAYEPLRDRLFRERRGRAFHRVLFPCAMFAVAWADAFGTRAPVSSLAGWLGDFDFHAVGIRVDQGTITRGGITRLSMDIRRSRCLHHATDNRTRLLDHDNPADPDSTFLDADRDLALEHYCTGCGHVFSSKIMGFRHHMVLDAVRRADPTGKGLLLADLIDLLRKEHLLVPTRNADHRKAQAGAYVAAKQFLRPFVDRGFLRVEDKTKHKRVWWVKRGLINSSLKDIQS